MPNIVVQRSILDFFVPEGLASIEAIKRWRVVVLMALLTVASSVAHSTFFAVLGLTSSALVLSFNGVLVLVLLLWAKRIGRIDGCLLAGAAGIMATLSFLTIATAGSSLAFLMWFSIVPPTAALGLGLRKMWVLSVAALALGAATLALPHLGLFPASNPISDSQRAIIEVSSWLMFMACSITAGYMLHVLNERSEEERQKFSSMTENSRRRQALGELAGGVAHEFNNLLTVIRGTANVIRAGAPQSSEIEAGLSDIEQAARRGGEIATELLLFARGRPVASTSVAETTKTLHTSLRFITAIVGPGIRVVSSIPDDLPRVAVNARTLEQSLLNMALNARDAITSGQGEIRVEAAALKLGADEGALLGISQGTWIRICIQDDGVGMDEETVARIYEPFFTTKDTGTGLGMAVVFGLLQQIGGAIEVTSEPGAGTKISIYLPLANDSSQAELAGTAPVQPAAESNANSSETAIDNSTVAGRILVVEDREDVRRMVRRILTGAGYAVIEAADGAEALTLVEPELQLIVSDVLMPVMGGAQLAQECNQRGSLVPIVFMTGFAGTEEEDRALLELGSTVLRKPFSSQALLQACEDAIGVKGNAAPPGPTCVS